MRTIVPLFALLAAACTKDGDSGDTDVNPGDIDGAVDGGADAYSSQWGIDGTNPDCEAIDLDGCTEPVVMEGDTRFYVGELVWDADGNVSGYEAKVLFPNAKWKETVTDVDDCLVVWQLSGTLTEGSGAYDYEFTLHAALDNGQSTCIGEYVAAESSSYDEGYYANVTDDGSATVYFAPSGNLFANGLASDSAVAFASGGDCEWIGTGECQQ